MFLENLKSFDHLIIAVDFQDVQVTVIRFWKGANCWGACRTAAKLLFNIYTEVL